MKLAVILPCYNEGIAIGQVVHTFRHVLPQASIYVYDNNSQDNTVAEAKKADAIVRHEPLQGKGHVVRRMFADIDADIYVMADGDGTYDASHAPELIEKLCQENLDMVIGARVAQGRQAYRLGHALGNRLFNWAVGTLFGNRFQDIFSGYRVFSRRFVKTFPALSQGFDIETELTVHALELNLPVAEVQTAYGDRHSGSFSKLRTLTDGLRILWRIGALMMHVRPLALFVTIGGLCILGAIGLGYPVIYHYLATGLVPRLPTAVLSTGLMIVGFLTIGCGLILNNVAHARKEMKRLFYLSH